MYWLAYVDDAGLVADFHTLRHTYITNIGRGGAKSRPGIPGLGPSLDAARLQQNRRDALRQAQDKQGIRRVVSGNGGNGWIDRVGRGDCSPPPPTPPYVRVTYTAVHGKHLTPAIRSVPCTGTRQAATLGGSAAYSCGWPRHYSPWICVCRASHVPAGSASHVRPFPPGMAMPFRRYYGLC